VKLKINGDLREVPDGLTVRALLDSLGLVAERVAVEVNTQVIRRVRHAEHRLIDGDEVEIVTFVGGG
jgi:sulfur carrier protein